ncbi:MAG: GNAT family N-acetyltransferase [Bacillota bacterium]
MNMTSYRDAASFLKSNEDYLIKYEVENSLMLGILCRLRKEGANPSDVFLSVEDDKEKLVAVMSGLYMILFATSDNPILYSELVEYLKFNSIDFPGVIGPKPICDHFKKAYQNIYNKTLYKHMDQRIYKLTRVNETKTKYVFMRLANKDDCDILIPWMMDFMVVAGEESSFEKAKNLVDKKVEEKQLYVLIKDNQIVSMTAKSRPFRKGITVSCVYTPIEERKKGYATKLVELVSLELLKEFDYCTLYTDLSNPTSNNIYQKIGYAPIIDSVVYLTKKDD